MSLQKTMTRTTHEEFPTPTSRETFIAPTLLPVCCVCKLIRDDTRFSSGRQLWITSRTYRETHAVDPNELAVMHTYCPKCLTKVQDTVR